MFGWPLAVASHHFDTVLPSSSPLTPNHLPNPTMCPNIALFQLPYVLGDIMDNAVSLRHELYDTDLAHDKLLTDWMEKLPTELDLDEFMIARALASPDTVARRLGVQSFIICTSYYHIRFTLHRPYASSSPSPPLSGSDKDKHDKHEKDPKAERQANSLDIAVGSADKLITLVDYARPDFLAKCKPRRIRPHVLGSLPRLQRRHVLLVPAHLQSKSARSRPLPREHQEGARYVGAESWISRRRSRN